MTQPSIVKFEDPLVMKSLLSYQSTLPKLPLPPLQQTLHKYLVTLRPLLSEDEYQHTKKIVDKFGKPGGKGEQLQIKLLQRAQKLDNWNADWWRDVTFLGDRNPTVISISPGAMFPVQDFSSQRDQLSFAAKLIAGILDFKGIVDSEKLPIDMTRGDRLCMIQYYKMFSTCRIPGPDRDSSWVYHGNKEDAPKHIIVMRNNHFFALDVYYPNGKPLRVNELYAQLVKVVNMSSKSSDPVGILTTENRDTWFKVNKKLTQLGASNAHIVETITRSLFILCLDEPINGPHQHRLSALANQILHGGGSHANSGNRWYDKTLQLIVSRDGNCGLVFEHAWLEGPPVATLLDNVLIFINNYSDEVKPESVHLPDPKRLQFNLSDDVIHDIEIAKRNLDLLVNDLQLYLFEFKPFGKNFPKQNNLSPDGFIQVAIQVAFYRMHRRITATYESCTTKRFKGGRTDTIRSCTIDSINFSKAMVDDSVESRERYRLLRKAVVTHKAHINDTIYGDGIDRHFFALNLTAKELGETVPDIFTDPAYLTAVRYALSSSQVPSDHVLVMCFGSVEVDGYGVAYNIRETNTYLAISCSNSCPETGATKFAKVLTDILLEMQALIVQNEGSKL
ncbi:carnitine O-acetyltransferase-like [Glandiceps talaboti]